MTQLQMFSSVSGQIEVGDVASSAKSYMWVVELQEDNGDWSPYVTFASREDAREHIRFYELSRARVVPYKACIDTKGRINRQVRNQRIDY